MTTETNGNNLLVQGRLVWTLGANLFEGKQKSDYNTNQPIIGNDGQPVVEYGFGLAIPKDSPQFQEVWNALHQEAFTLYPSGQLPPDFAMKYKDGDGVDHNGKPYADREGYANHIILTCTTQIPIKWFIFEGGNNILVNTGVKCGDYVEVQLNLKAHPAKGRGKPGLYLNPSAARLIQPGKEIINAPSGDQIFGQNAPAYSGQVIADTAPAMPNMGQAMGAPLNAPVTAPAMPAATPTTPAPQAPVAPTQAAPAHYGVLPQQHQPTTPAPQAPVLSAPTQAAPAIPQMPAAPGVPQ